MPVKRIHGDDSVYRWGTWCWACLVFDTGFLIFPPFFAYFIIQSLTFTDTNIFFQPSISICVYTRWFILFHLCSTITVWPIIFYLNWNSIFVLIFISYLPIILWQHQIIFKSFFVVVVSDMIQGTQCLYIYSINVDSSRESLDGMILTKFETSLQVFIVFFINPTGEWGIFNK